MNTNNVSAARLAGKGLVGKACLGAILADFETPKLQPVAASGSQWQVGILFRAKAFRDFRDQIWRESAREEAEKARKSLAGGHLIAASRG